MRFSTLVAFILPLSALTPTLRHSTGWNRNPLSGENFQLAVNIGPQRTDLLNDLNRLGVNIKLIP